MNRALLLGLLLLAAGILPRVDAVDSSCLEKGFTDATQCSKCDKLAEFTHNLELIDECNRCCSEDHGDSATTYVKAVLAVNTAVLGQYPNVNDFLQKYSKHFPRLEVQYTRNPFPKLYMLTIQGEHVPIKMLTWSADQIRDFLQEKLK